MVGERADENADSDHAVDDDHDRRKDRVARERGFVGAAGQHHRQDEGHLDHRDRDREHERAVGLAHAMRHHLGVVHGGNDRGHERNGATEGQRRRER